MAKCVVRAVSCILPEVRVSAVVVHSSSLQGDGVPQLCVCH